MTEYHKMENQTLCAKFAATLSAEQQTKFAALQAAAEFLRERAPGGRH